MSVTHDPGELVCPTCSTHNSKGICGIQLINPVGCDETIIVIRCAGCTTNYLEIEEDGFSHRDGPDYWTRGPFSERQGCEIIGRVHVCPDPFNNLCSCPSHKFMDNLMYGLFRVNGDTSGSNGDRPEPLKDDSTGNQTPVIATPKELEEPKVPDGGASPSEPAGGVTQLPLIRHNGNEEAANSPADDHGTRLEESAVELKTALEEAVPGADVQMMIKSMAWARGKLGSPSY